jgi:hypothetical protein
MYGFAYIKQINKYYSTKAFSLKIFLTSDGHTTEPTTADQTVVLLPTG